MFQILLRGSNHLLLVMYHTHTYFHMCVCVLHVVVTLSCNHATNENVRISLFCQL